MRSKYLLIVMMAVLAVACKKETSDQLPGNGPGNGPGTDNPNPPPPPPPPPPVTVHLKDIVTPSLPSPYYHLEYDDEGRVNFISFASDFNRYHVKYNGSKISEMQNDIIVNKDRLQYTYNNEGKLVGIDYNDENGLNPWKKITFIYIGDQLTGIVWNRKQGQAFPVEKTMTLQYFADGNLSRITHFRPANAVLQTPQSTYFENFEDYDNKINTDDFTLIHDDFFDHVFLLPFKLQKNNPRRTSVTGVTNSHEVVYTYTYNDKGAPTLRTGAGTITSGPQGGTEISVKYYLYLLLNQFNH